MTITAHYRLQDCDIADFAAHIDRHLSASDVPLAEDIASNIPIYNVQQLTAKRMEVMAEWNAVLRSGSGALLLKGAFPDAAPIDAATKTFLDIIDAEKDGTKSDHFATAGSNARIWNSHQKLCLANPEAYVEYTANPWFDAACEAWLGPGYQVTAQVNLVRPGGSAQEAHRDYHLGFQSQAQAARYPALVHDVSAALTLQGAIAHCDMPIESGPTKLLPFSQSYGPGYLAYHQPEFRELFEKRHVQIPLVKGDMLFFNPALFHAAGANTSADIQRMANLVQISSAFGRAMETLDRNAMCRAAFEPLAASDMSSDKRAAVIAATAEGYAFPTNLDSDPPKGGHAPLSQAEIMTQMLDAGEDLAGFSNALDALSQRQRP